MNNQSTSGENTLKTKQLATNQSTEKCINCRENYDTAYRTPRILHCSHMFCQDCLCKKGLCIGSGIRCLECNEISEVNSIIEIPLNINLFNDMLLSQLRASSFIKCGYHKKKLIGFCKKCNLFICLDCNQFMHKRTTACEEMTILEGLKFYDKAKIDSLTKLTNAYSKNVESMEKFHLMRCLVSEKALQTCVGNTAAEKKYLYRIYLHYEDQIQKIDVLKRKYNKRTSVAEYIKNKEMLEYFANLKLADDKDFMRARLIAPNLYKDWTYYTRAFKGLIQKNITYFSLDSVVDSEYFPVILINGEPYVDFQKINLTPELQLSEECFRLKNDFLSYYEVAIRLKSDGSISLKMDLEFIHNMYTKEIQVELLNILMNSQEGKYIFKNHANAVSFMQRPCDPEERNKSLPKLFDGVDQKDYLDDDLPDKQYTHLYVGHNPVVSLAGLEENAIAVDDRKFPILAYGVPYAKKPCFLFLMTQELNFTLRNIILVGYHKFHYYGDMSPYEDSNWTALLKLI